MKVFIAGASGVLGRRLVRQFVARGHSVIGQVRSPKAEIAVKEPAASRGTQICSMRNPWPKQRKVRHRHSRGHGHSGKTEDDSRRLGDERPHSPQRHALPHRSRSEDRRENLFATKHRLGGAA